MIEAPTNGTDNSSSGGTSPSHTRNRQLSHELHAAKANVAVLNEQEVCRKVSDKFHECKRWLGLCGYEIAAASFEEMHAILAKEYGIRDRAMLYRTFLYHQVFEMFGFDCIMPSQIDDSATVRGYMGSGGSCDVWYGEANIDALRAGAPLFAAEMLSASEVRTDEKAEALVSALRGNIEDLERETRHRIVSKVYRVPPLNEDLERESWQRAGREMRRLCTNLHSPLKSIIPQIVGGRLHDNDWHFHVIHEAGVDLHTFIKAAGEKMPWRVTMDLCAHFARIVKLFENAGMVHQDLKPGNMFVREKGDIGILDLGTTKFTTNDSANLTQGIHGTFEYISPEQASPQKTPPTLQSDVYSMGLVMLSFVGAVAPSHFPEGFLDDRNRVETVTHRAVLQKEWIEKQDQDSFTDVRDEWEKKIDIHFPKHLEDEAVQDPRMARYLEAWRKFVWSMLHPIPAMRPTPTQVFHFFVSHSRFAKAPNIFLKTGMAQHQTTRRDFAMTDPLDPHPLLKKILEESTLPEHLGKPWGHDALADFKYVPLIRATRRHTRYRTAAILASTVGAAGVAAFLLSREHRGKQDVPVQQIPEAPVESAIKAVERELHEPTMIVRTVPVAMQSPAGYEGLPVDKVIRFPEGAIAFQQGYPRGFDLIAGQRIRRNSVSYCIDALRGDPAQETSMMGFFLSPEEQLQLQGLFTESKDVTTDASNLNTFLFSHGSEHLLLLPGGRGLLVREQNGVVSSGRFTTSNADKAVRDLCATLLKTQFNGYVSPKELSSEDVPRVLRDHMRKAYPVLQQYVPSLQ